MARRRLTSAVKSTTKIDIKTGRRVRKNMAKSRKMKMVARKRKNRPLKAATKLAIKRSLKRVRTTGRTVRGKRKAKF